MRCRTCCIPDHWLVVISFCKFFKLKWHSMVSEWVFSEVEIFAYPFKAWLILGGNWVPFRLWYATITLRGRFLRGSHVSWELSWWYQCTRYDQLFSFSNECLIHFSMTSLKRRAFSGCFAVGLLISALFAWLVSVLASSMDALLFLGNGKFHLSW